MNKISFENVTKKFHGHFWEKPHVALDEVSFTLEKGELIGFLGANGAGKTTAIKLLLGFIKEDSGQVSFHGFKNNSRQGFIEVLGYLPEKTYVYQHLTGFEFLHYVGSLHSVSRQDLNSRVKLWGERLSIFSALERQIKTYSKGMQQRLCFLAALLNNPQVLILDEPLSGLDPLGRREFKDIFTELNQKYGTTIFFSSHVVSDVEEICNKVLFIERGKMIYAGAIDQIIHENRDNNYRIKYFEDNVLKTELIDIHEKDSKLRDLIARNLNIVELEKNRTTLESIVYKIRESK